MRLIRTILPLSLVLVADTATSQINIGDKLEQKAKQRLERKVDRTIDKGFDKTEQGVDQGAKEAVKGRKENEVAGGDDAGTTTTAGENRSAAPASAATEKEKMTVYSKFDFVAGEKVIAMEDYSQEEIGDFPARWNTNTSGEIVTIGGVEGRWLKLSGSGIYHPEFVGVLPENFTLEFQAAVDDGYHFVRKGIYVNFVPDGGNILRFDNRSLVAVGLHPNPDGNTDIAVYGNDHRSIMSNHRKQHQYASGTANVVNVSMWRQKNRLRVYLNEEKVWDIPRAFQNDVDYRLVFKAESSENNIPYLGNIRMAAGAPDTRNKLITEGRFVTSGILFDSGSDRIKPESYGTIKEIATVLQENGDVRVRIVGHTDSDGDDARNLDLSKRRAAAVKEILGSEFKIDGGRLETDGKGESQPAGPNDTPQGKANNRRVEFVKL